MSLSRTRLLAAAVLLLAVAGCGTAPDRPEPTPTAVPLADPIRGQVVAKDGEAGNGPAGPMGDLHELTVCLLDSDDQPTDECMQVALRPELWESYDVGDPYPVEGTLLDPDGVS